MSTSNNDNASTLYDAYVSYTGIQPLFPIIGSDGGAQSVYTAFTPTGLAEPFDIPDKHTYIVSPDETVEYIWPFWGESDVNLICQSKGIVAYDCNVTYNLPVKETTKPSFSVRTFGKKLQIASSQSGLHRIAIYSLKGTLLWSTYTAIEQGTNTIFVPDKCFGKEIYLVSVSGTTCVQNCKLKIE